MAAQIFPPHHRRGAAIHDEVRPLVDEGHVVHGRFGHVNHQAQKPDESQADERERIAANQMAKGFHGKEWDGDMTISAGFFPARRCGPDSGARRRRRAASSA